MREARSVEESRFTSMMRCLVVREFVTEISDATGRLTRGPNRPGRATPKNRRGVKPGGRKDLPRQGKCRKPLLLKALREPRLEPEPFVANETLYQLSYTPSNRTGRPF